MNKYLGITILLFPFMLGFSCDQLLAKDDAMPAYYNLEKDKSIISNSDLKQAKIYYEEGQYQQAIALLQSIINQSQENNNSSLKLEGLTNLSLIYLKTQDFIAVEENIERVFNELINIENENNRNKIYNFALEIKGQLELNKNQLEQSFKTWNESSLLAYSRGDLSKFIYAKSKQIEVLQELGLYGQATEILTEIEPQLMTAPPDLITAQAWKTIANISIKLGNVQNAEDYILKSLEIANNSQNQDVIADILTSKGDIDTTIYQWQLNKNKGRIPTQENIQRIVQNYQESFSSTNNRSLKITAQLKELYTLIYFHKNIPEKDKYITLTEYISFNSNKLINNIYQEINNLPLDKILINQRLILVDNLFKLEPKKYQKTILEQLTNALKESDRLNYQRGKSEALGNLGKLYQQSEKLSEARQLTEKALYISETIQAPDLAYQWQWQLGKIYKQTNNRKQSIVAYSGAVNTLTSLRRELVGINSNLEFSFRENIEPVYRELVDIILQSNPTQTELQLARETIENLQIAELDNYFRDACLDVKETNLDNVIDEKTAVFYPIILEDRIEVIVSLGNKSITSYRTNIKQDIIEKQIEELENYFNQESTAQISTLNKSLNNLYNYLVEPIREQLNTLNIQNLVFIGDGTLKKIPISALYDGQQYLVENYNIAIAPSLKLIEYETTDNKEYQALLAGLGELNPNNTEADFFNSLENVKTELDTIKNLIPQTQIILDQIFTEKKLEEEIKLSYPQIVHIATHGIFSSELENTFLLTWDEKIDLQELSNLFSQYRQEKQTIDLLILSACQTALGDKRAALGLAGVGIKAGARSTVASLWFVDDESTSFLMSNFYQELFTSKVSKANALRQAQLAMINSNEYNHPYYWSAFILIGNWL